MLDLFANMFRRKPAMPVVGEPRRNPYEVDRALEDAIDKVGRGRVFARAEANGWYDGAVPPKWVWWMIVRQLKQEDAMRGMPAAPPLNLARQDGA